MALSVQSSFSAGELDPALHERTTFDKYQSGLKTLRNTYIGKTGRLMSRSGKLHYMETKSATASAGTFTAAASDICTKAGHVMGTGTLVQVSNSGGALPAGLSASTDYYAIWLTKDTFSLATSLALATAGTAVNITGTGTGTHTITPTDVGAKKSILYCPEYSQYVVEFGHRYLRVHDPVAGTYLDEGHELTEDDLDYVQFNMSGAFLWITRKGFKIRKLTLSTATFVADSSIFYGLGVPTDDTGTNGGTGYRVEYAVTYVLLGQESKPLEDIDVAALYKLPIAVTESNIVRASVVAIPFNSISEFKFYRRPKDGSAYGYIGSHPGTSLNDLGYEVAFTDLGQDADYTHSPPVLDASIVQISPTYGALSAEGRCSTIYEQRLLITQDTNEEAIHASRTGFHNNFYRDYPLGSDSALTFKCGTTGNAKILRLMDNGGLLAFTTVGIYQNSGVLSPTNLAMDHKGNWVIEEKVPPLKIPGGLLFVDKATNTVRSLIFSNEAGGYPGEEISIFSNHLFENKRVLSWAFQDGDIPLIWVVMDDGTLNCLTYQREHEMRAWHHHDTPGGLYESVCVLKDLSNKSVAYFVVNRDGTRYIEKSSPRFVADLKDYVGMDSAVTFKTIVSDEQVTVTATDISDWAGELTLTASAAIFSNVAGLGAVGTIFRFFDSEGSAVDLEVTTYTSTTVLKVMPTCEFPSNEASDVTLYKTFTTLTGLAHLQGQFVSILADGYVLASPLNNIDNYPECSVAGGTLTLPNGERGAIIHVGLPYACDVETLDIDTVEQKPTLIESLVVSQIYMKVLNTRGLYMGSEFPVNDYVDGMTDCEQREEDPVYGIIGNAAQAPVSKRLELSIDNDWKSQGRVCIRQVDPLPFEILSLIPDTMVLWRK